MLFNSIDFAIFLPVVFGLYWMLQRYAFQYQNALLLLASYVFYGWWDWRFLSLIAFSTLVDFWVGIQMARSVNQTHRKLLLWLSILVNLGFLGLFKYFHFFLDNFRAAFSLFGAEWPDSSLNIILPVGISFYTFQTLSYTIDIYRHRLKPTSNWVAFAAFVSFFPQLVAGPIERAGNLLPQFTAPRQFNYTQAVDGLRQILWGLFKKMVIADNCAELADAIFSNPSAHSGSTLFLGGLFFAFQIYGDFSGYSDIAIGTARLFGFQLMRNFAYPYFARDIAEFWRRWHISLSTWFRDYLYIPLGGSRGSTWLKVRNTFIIFLVSGFWHGANWTFLVWGFLHALYFLPLLLRNKNRSHLDVVAQGRLIPNGRELFGMLSTFALTVLAWVFFRAESLSDAFQYLRGIFHPSLFHWPAFPSNSRALIVLLLIAFFTMLEWLGRQQPHALAHLGLHWPRSLRWSFYAFLLFLIGIFLHAEETPFIYFQF